MRKVLRLDFSHPCYIIDYEHRENYSLELGSQ